MSSMSKSQNDKTEHNLNASRISKTSNETTPYQSRHSPPFRLGGRGSKQLSKALEKSNIDGNIDDRNCVIFTGNASLAPCFAKVLRTNDHNTVVIESMHPNLNDPGLFQPCHIYIVENREVLPVQVLTIHKYAFVVFDTEIS